MSGNKSKLLKELVRRRDEVIRRATGAIRGDLPDHLLFHGKMEDIFRWVIEPHTTEKYTIHRNIDSKKTRDMISKVLNKIYCEDDKCDAKE